MKTKMNKIAAFVVLFASSGAFAASGDTSWKRISLQGNDGYSVEVNYQIDFQSESEAGSNVIATPVWVNLVLDKGGDPNESYIAVLSSSSDDPQEAFTQETTPAELNFDNSHSSESVTGYTGQLIVPDPVDVLVVGHTDLSNQNVSPTHQVLTITHLNNNKKQVFNFKLFN
jgi:hypothetical protein